MLENGHDRHETVVLQRSFGLQCIQSALAAGYTLFFEFRRLRKIKVWNRSPFSVAWKVSFGTTFPLILPILAHYELQQVAHFVSSILKVDLSTRLYYPNTYVK